MGGHSVVFRQGEAKKEPFMSRDFSMIILV